MLSAADYADALTRTQAQYLQRADYLGAWRILTALERHGEDLHVADMPVPLPTRTLSYRRHDLFLAIVNGHPP